MPRKKNIYQHCKKFIKRSLQFITVSLKAVWLLFPAFLFLFAAYACFWLLSQGRDVLICMLEKKAMGGIVLLAILFWTMVTWYSSRIIVYRQEILYRQNKEIAFHAPRLMGFLGYSIIWIGLLRLPSDAYLGVHVGSLSSYILLVFSVLAYATMYQLFKKFRDRQLSQQLSKKNFTPEELAQKAEKEDKRFFRIYRSTGIIVLLLLIINTALNYAWLFMFAVILLQVIFLFIVVIRRGRLQNTVEDRYEMPQDYGSIHKWQESENEKGNFFSIGPWERILYYANIPQKEKWFFKIYNIIAAISLCIYFTTIVNYSFSQSLGSFATVMNAFGVLIGVFSFITFLSVSLKINIHVFVWIGIWIFGKIFEPHYVNILKPSGKTAEDSISFFAARPTLDEYFNKWVAQRKDAIMKDTAYPVFVVLADGGASRSGYWTSSVLGKLEDTTHGMFSEHLFCLSGASGGSVGTSTFLALLKHKDQLQQQNKTFVTAADEFLKSDFLTFTLARMLGPDFIRPMIPLPWIDDRATALEHAVEQGNSNAFLHGVYADSFSRYIPFINGNNNLPMICINSTRMQDGRPSVISNVKIDSVNFGQRIDILDSLKPGQNIKLSTSVIMGARFPYVSPAGRIEKSYYVDGGYFDNSGAGVVNEMLLALYKQIKDCSDSLNYLNHLRFYIIHAENGYNNTTVSKVHPIINDLAAPVLTLIGSYGTQTSVNDWRLQKFMESKYYNSTETGYHRVNLYAPIDGDSTEQEFPMNWVISDYYRKKMDSSLHNTDMKALIQWMQPLIRN